LIQKEEKIDFTNVPLDVDSEFLDIIFEFHENSKEIDKENWQLCVDTLIDVAKEKFD